jgi:hypothetical protein
MKENALTMECSERESYCVGFIKPNFSFFMPATRKIVFLLFVIMAQLFSKQVAAQVTYNNASSAVFSASSTTLTFSHTTGAGSNKLLLVGVSSRDRLVSGVTYDGTPLSFVISELSNTDAYTYIYRMVNPPSGTFDVVVTLSSNSGSNHRPVAGAISFFGVDQSTPTSVGSTSAGNSNSVGTGIVTIPGDMAFAVLSSTSNAPTVSDGVERWNQAASRPHGAGATKLATSALTNLGFTFSSNQWSLSALNIIQVCSLAAATVNKSDITCFALEQWDRLLVSAPTGGSVSTYEYQIKFW